MALFSKEELDRVLKSKEYSNWSARNKWILDTPSDETLR